MSSSVKNLEELQWIDEPAQPAARPDLEEFELMKPKSFSDTILRKAQENIFVPIGLLATTACLTMGLVNMKKGDSKKQQVFMRGRVGFQAFTLAAMTLGMFLHRRNEAHKKNG